MNDKERGAGYILVSKGLATQLGAILIRNLIHSKKNQKNIILLSCHIKQMIYVSVCECE